MRCVPRNERALYQSWPLAIIFVFHKLGPFGYGWIFSVCDTWRRRQTLSPDAFDRAHLVLDSRPFSATSIRGTSMGASGPQKSNSSVDAIATVVIIAAVALSVSFWLAGMPG
jgi:hypothetical protein